MSVLQINDTAIGEHRWMIASIHSEKSPLQVECSSGWRMLVDHSDAHALADWIKENVPEPPEPLEWGIDDHDGDTNPGISTTLLTSGGTAPNSACTAGYPFRNAPLTSDPIGAPPCPRSPRP